MGLHRIEKLSSCGCALEYMGLLVREDLLYASYDERKNCMPVMMRGPIVCQL